MSIFHDARKPAQPAPEADFGKPPKPYDWQARPATEDTDASVERVLRDSSKPRR